MDSYLEIFVIKFYPLFKLMQRIVRFLRSINKKLLLLFIICLIWSILIEFVFNQIPAMFPKAYEVGQYIDKICFSIITGTIFYILTVHYEKYRNKKNINQFVVSKLEEIIRIIGLLMVHMEEKVGLETKTELPTRKEFEKICYKLDLYSKAPYGTIVDGKFVPLNWFEYLDNCWENIAQEIQSLYGVTNYLDSDLLVLIGKIQNRDFFRLILNSGEAKLSISLDMFKDSFWNYLEDIKYLERYKNKLAEIYG